MADPFPSKGAIGLSVRGEPGGMLSPERDTLCVLYDDGTAACREDDADSPVATYAGGDAVAVVAHPGGDGCVLRAGGNVACTWSSTVYTGGDAVQMDVGHHGVCAVTSSGHVVCSDGFTDAAGTAVQVASAPTHLCILRLSGGFDCVGDNEWGAAVASSRTDGVALQAFYGSTCALTSAGTTWCQGGYDCEMVADAEACSPGDPPPSYDGGDAAAHFAGPKGQCWRFQDGSFACNDSVQPLVLVPRT